MLEFYYAHKDASVEALVHDVMVNVKMWGQDLTAVPGFEAATVKNLEQIRKNGTLAAFASCL